jgi:hypothetical protein
LARRFLAPLLPISWRPVNGVNCGIAFCYNDSK